MLSKVAGLTRPNHHIRRDQKARVRARSATKSVFAVAMYPPAKWAKIAADAMLPGVAILGRLAAESVAAAKSLLVAERALRVLYSRGRPL